MQLNSGGYQGAAQEYVELTQKGIGRAQYLSSKLLPSLKVGGSKMDGKVR